MFKKLHDLASQPSLLGFITKISLTILMVLAIVVGIVVGAALVYAIIGVALVGIVLYLLGSRLIEWLFQDIPPEPEKF